MTRLDRLGHATLPPLGYDLGLINGCFLRFSDTDRIQFPQALLGKSSHAATKAVEGVSRLSAPFLRLHP